MPRALAASIAALTLAACASTSPPNAELASARALVSQALPAARYAPGSLAAAQEKLARAELAMARYDYEEARRLAEQASADARLAEAVAESERMKQAAAEVNDATRALRAQLERSRP